MKYYKFLTDKNHGEYSHYDYTLYLPRDGRPGPWLPKIPAGEIEFCKRGYHAATRDRLMSWINAQLFEVELNGVIDDTGKSVSQTMRFIRCINAWNDSTARLFAVWCARQALALVGNPDPRLLTACDVAERYANGEATAKELAAAWEATWAAAYDAASAAAYAAYAAARAAAYAAHAAAYDAARAAAYNAAYDAARAAAYDAAWAAAYDAARAAAYAAHAAARAAARDAARDAASAAARAAAYNAQNQHLAEMLGLEAE